MAQETAFGFMYRDDISHRCLAEDAKTYTALRLRGFTGLVTRRSLVAVLAALLLGVTYAQTASAATKPTPTKGVVIINTDLALQDARAAGTGIVLTKTGQVLTNNHVIAGATTIRVTVPATHKTYIADVVGYDISDDVALLQLENAANVPTATLGNSANVKVGQAATAVGNA